MQTFHVGVKGVVVKDNKILFLKRKSKTLGYVFWDMPGGRMEENELPKETLKRELMEEAGVELLHVNDLITYHIHPRYNNKGVKLLLLYFKVQVNTTEIEISSEHLGFKWIGVDDLDLLDKSIMLEEHTKKILEKLLK